MKFDHLSDFFRIIAHGGAFSPRRLNAVSAVFLAFVTLAVYSQVVRHGFVNLDDPVMVYANPHLQAGVTIDSIRWAFSSGYEANWIPLSWISHMIDIQLFGQNAGWHHLINLLFHTASTVLLFLSLEKATSARAESAMAAFLFALHPLHVESVAWVAERKDVLSAFFWMMTIYQYVHYVEKRGTTRYLVVLFMFVLGLLSKPMVVTLPVILLLLDWWPLRRLATCAPYGGHSPVTEKPVMLCVEKIPFFVLSAASSLVTYMVQQRAGELLTDLSVPERAARACVSYVAYLQKTVWPSGLAVFYPFVETPPSTLAVGLSFLALLLLTGAVFRYRNRCPFMITGWLWYLVTLLPVIGFVPIGQHSIADRYTYIPLIGLFIFGVWGISWWMEIRGADRTVAAIVSFSLLVVTSALTWIQVGYWKNSVTLLSHAIEVTENNWLALNNLGMEHLTEERVDEALWLFNESIKAKPTYILALLNLGAAHSMKNDYESAIDAFKRVLRFEPANEKAHLSLGLMYLQTGEKGYAMKEYEALLASGSAFAPHLLREIAAYASNAQRE